MVSKPSLRNASRDEANLKAKHHGEWILILKNGKYVHAKKLEDAYAKISDVSQIITTLRPYKPQELLLY